MKTFLLLITILTLYSCGNCDTNKSQSYYNKIEVKYKYISDIDTIVYRSIIQNPEFFIYDEKLMVLDDHSHTLASSVRTYRILN